MSVGAEKIAVTVAEVVEVNELIKRFRFVRRDGGRCRRFRAVRIQSSRWTTMAHGG
jgi:hypothetical protein